MSQWQQIQQLQGKLVEQVDALYADGFPMQIRHVFADWIESQDWESAVNQESVASLLMVQLLTLVEQHFSQQQELVLRHSLKRIYQQLQVQYQEIPQQLAGIIAFCLREEQKILKVATSNQQQQVPKNPMSEAQHSIDSQVVALHNNLQVIGQAVKHLADSQEAFEFQYTTLKSHQTGQQTQAEPLGQGGQEKTNNSPFKNMVAVLNFMLNEIDSQRKAIITNLAGALKEVEQLMFTHLAPELSAWKRRQQISCIGGPIPTGLDQLQHWFTSIAKCLFLIKRQLDKLEHLVQNVTYDSDPITQQRPQLEAQIKTLINSLIQSSFVVEKQPCMYSHPQKPLVIKTGVQFNTKVQLLVRLPELDYQVEVVALIDMDLEPGAHSREFCINNNNSKVMDVDESTRCLSAEFKHMCLKEKKSSSSAKGSEGSFSVTEELHCLSFQAQICLLGLKINLQTSSLPLVVISNVSQLTFGWASVMWYNMLTNELKNLAFFRDPPKACWPQICELLQWQFCSLTGRGLSDEQLSILGEKLIGDQVQQCEAQVSGCKFWKDNMSGKDFSFWVWLDSILDLIKRFLHPFWINGYILGFVSKEKERELLQDKETGTFLLRFSESLLGGITFTWVEKAENGEVAFNSVEPYTKNYLSALPFANIMRDYKVIVDGFAPENPLKFLYPDIPKDQAFGNYYSNQPPSKKSSCTKAHTYLPTFILSCSTHKSCRVSDPQTLSLPLLLDLPPSLFGNEMMDFHQLFTE